MRHSLIIAKKDLRQAYHNRYILGILALSALTSAALRFGLHPEVLTYAQPNTPTGATALTIYMSVLTPILMIGTMLVPLLMVEEKELQTIRFLRVSPASLHDVLLGKALVGVILGLVIALISLLITGDFSNRLSLVSMSALLLTSALGSCTGLFLSAFFGTALQANTWSFIPLVMLLMGFLPDLLPSSTDLTTILKVLPTYSISALLHASLGTALELTAMIGHGLYLATWIVLTFALANWLYQREE